MDRNGVHRRPSPSLRPGRVVILWRLLWAYDGRTLTTVVTKWRAAHKPTLTSRQRSWAYVQVGTMARRWRPAANIWNLATPDSDIEGCIDIEAVNIEGCFDIDSNTQPSISNYQLLYRSWQGRPGQPGRRLGRANPLLGSLTGATGNPSQWLGRGLDGPPGPLIPSSQAVT